jgi:threonine synthase
VNPVLGVSSWPTNQKPTGYAHISSNLYIKARSAPRVPSFRCVGCSRFTDTDRLDPVCNRCGSSVILDFKRHGALRRSQFEDSAGLWRYSAFLPSIAAEDVVTLGEGGTPLIRAERLGRELGLPNLLIKDESRNPTGSFLDRGSTILVSLAKKRGVRECTCVTTGNLGASLAAYCAKAELRARVKIHPSTDSGKLYQMLAYGAEIEAPPSRPGPQARDDHTLAVTAGNPYLLEGEKTTGFEIIHELRWRTPDVIVVPVGTGGHLSMIWHAIKQLRESGLVGESECRLLGVQLEEAPAPGWPNGRRLSASSALPLTELEDSEPFFREESARAMSQSKGHTLTTTSADTVGATGLLARTEGIFAEPASASAIASIAAAAERGVIRRDEIVVCVITGAGLKDTKAVSRLAKEAKRVTAREGFALPTPQIGATKLVLLRLLRKRPGYGYDLRRQLSPERHVTTASVYQHLTELEGFALVRRTPPVTSKGRERVVYELTKKGADFLKIAERLERAGSLVHR